MEDPPSTMKVSSLSHPLHICTNVTGNLSINVQYILYRSVRIYTQRILLSSLATERIFNYSFLLNLKMSCSSRTCSLFILNGNQSTKKLYYINYLHYITLLWYFATCTAYITVVYILQLAL